VVSISSVRALERGSRLKTHQNIRGWLTTIVRNLAIDRWRGKRHLIPLDWVSEPPAEEPQPARPWTAFDTNDIRRALEKCSPLFRTVYQLHELQGLSYEETSRLLAVPVATVATRLFRARCRLRQILTEEMQTRPMPSFDSSFSKGGTLTLLARRA